LREKLGKIFWIINGVGVNQYFGTFGFMINLQNMKTAISIIFFVGLVLFGTSEVFAQCACSRKNVSASEEFKLADIVFVGEVVEIKRTTPDKQNRYTETTTFKVKSAWKKDLEEFVTVTNEIYGCINGFEKGKEWLVYAYEGKDNKLSNGCCCSRTKSLPKAAEDLKEFEQYGEKPTTIVKKQSRK
jgi:hypothetical protein